MRGGQAGDFPAGPPAPCFATNVAISKTVDRGPGGDAQPDLFQVGSSGLLAQGHFLLLARGAAEMHLDFADRQRM